MSEDNVQDYKIQTLFYELERLRGAVETGFAEMRQILDQRLESRDERLENHEERLRVLERRVAVQSAWFAILGLIGGSAVTVIVTQLLT
jgi:hypothetical protein